MKDFSLKEMIEILYYEARNLAIGEMKNYNKDIFIQKAKNMVKSIGDDFKPIPAGIRAQLLNTNELVQDFIVELNSYTKCGKSSFYMQFCFYSVYSR